VMIAPVDGSGSWPAWIQMVGKRALSGSFTALTVSSRACRTRHHG
jgi:hypothetical protein